MLALWVERQRTLAEPICLLEGSASVNLLRRRVRILLRFPDIRADEATYERPDRDNPDVGKVAAAFHHMDYGRTEPDRRIERSA